MYSPLTWRSVLDSLASGDPRPEISSSLGQLYGMPHVVLTNSGTAALSIALRAAVEQRPGGLCLLPAYGCYDLASAALSAGVRVALYDVEPTTLAPLVESIAPLITEECAAVVVVDHYGLPTSLDELQPLATAFGVPVIEDAAQAAGAFWDGVRVGRRADAVVLSFGRGKGVTAGAGGALLLRQGSVLQRASLAPLEGRRDSSVGFSVKLAAQFLLARPGLYGIPARIPFLRLGETMFRPPESPAAMSAQAARVLTRTLPGMDLEAGLRRENADRLRLVQDEVDPQTKISVDPRAQSGWLRLPHLTHPGRHVSRAEAAELGVAPGYPQTLATLAELVPILETAGPFPGAVSLSQRLWTLPTHSALSSRAMMRLEKWVAAGKGRGAVAV